MCGIAGWIADPKENLGDEVIERVLEAIAHRGPDGAGTCAFESRSTRKQVVLGHRRLAIIDPEGAHQPWVDERAGIALTFNGEIYNFRELREQLVKRGYKFTRDSDTEVLLRAYQHWDKEVVNHLRGQFAFALWDARKERLLLARDRFGEKPLYLAERNGSLYFASEAKALLRIPGINAEVELPAVWDYLSYRYVPGPRTLFKGIRKLPPATYALWQFGRLREVRYWFAPDRKPLAVNDGDVSVEGFLAKLEESVKLQMVSDVPFGAFLSGGLDSSTIVALMSKHNSKVKTFSVGFGEDKYSELPYAGQVAKEFGTDHQEIVVTERDMIAELPRLVAYRDAPVAEPSDIPIYLMAKVASRKVKMVLTGEGSDELLGGYPKHVMESSGWGVRALPWKLLSPFINSLPYGFRRAKTAAINLGIDDWKERYVRWFGALSHRERTCLVNGVFKDVRSGIDLSAPATPPFDAEPGNSDLRRVLYFDQTSWLPDNLLERGDRMTMAASIEARVPFLDHRLAEHVSGLPDELRVRGLKTKWILREAARKILPRKILKRPKVGFRVPVNQWFRGELRDFLLDHLQGSGSLTRQYYAHETLDRVIDEHLQRRQNHEKLLWTLLNLEIWHRTYRPA